MKYAPIWKTLKVAQAAKLEVMALFAEDQRNAEFKSRMQHHNQSPSPPTKAPDFAAARTCASGFSYSRCPMNYDHDTSERRACCASLLAIAAAVVGIAGVLAFGFIRCGC